MTKAKRFRLLDLIEEIRKVDVMIKLHTIDSSAMMLDQYRRLKDQLVNELILELEH